MKHFWILALVAGVWACQSNSAEEQVEDTKIQQEEQIETPAPEAQIHADHGHISEAASMDPESEFLVVPENAKVFFVNLSDGQNVPNELKVVMGVSGMEVHPAGELIAGTGHHHILIDGKPMEKGMFIPKDGNHIHFGDGQTEATITVPSGEHTLTLQFANGAHFSYGEQLSATITVTAP